MTAADIAIGRPETSPEDLNTTERCTWTSLRSMVAVVDRAIDHDLVKAVGLPQSYLHILCTLASAPAGAMRMNEIADANGLSGSRVSHAASRLEERGLVQRTRRSQDRRVITLEITSSGRTALTEASGHLAVSARKHLLSRLSAVQRDQLMSIADTVAGGA